MFILYMNDISNDTSCNIKLFVDDCLIYRRIKDHQDTTDFQRDLDQLCLWASRWQMNFNPEKCSVLTITRKKTPVTAEYSMLGTKLKHYDHHPYLGVEIAQDLDWGEHIKATTTKAHRSLKLLRRNLSGCSRETKDKAYNTMVRPILEYAGAVWDPYQSNHIDTLEKVQRKAARFVCSDELLGINELKHF